MKPPTPAVKREPRTFKFECPDRHWSGQYQTAMDEADIQLHCRHCGSLVKAVK